MSVGLSAGSRPPHRLGRTRRDFVRVAGGGLFALGAVGCPGGRMGAGEEDAGLTDAAAEPDLAPLCAGALVQAGPTQDVAAGGAKWIECGRVFLCRDTGGLYALTSVCPHNECDVELSGRAFDCPCHGSRFDFEGGLLRGPATEPLVHLAVTVTEGVATIDLNQTVSKATRTKG